MRLLALCLFLAPPAAAQNCLARQVVDSVPNSGADFGARLEFDGRWAVVGAPGHDDAGVNAGAITYLDVPRGEVRWRVTDPDATSQDRFGAAVDMDAAYVIAGSPGAEAAYILDRMTGEVLHRLTPTLGPGRFGESVAIHDGLVLVGAFETTISVGQEGAAYVFDAASGALVSVLPAPSGTGLFGKGLDLDDTYAAIGARFDSAHPAGVGGVVHLFELATGQITTSLYDHSPSATDDFGFSVSLDGGRVMVGNPDDDPLTPGVRQGSVGVFSVPGGTPLNLLTPPGPTPRNFGYAVDSEGPVTIVGAPTFGTSHWGRVMLFDTGNGQPLAELHGTGFFGGDAFGTAVAVRGDWALVGASGKRVSVLPYAGPGAVRLYALDGPDCDGNGTPDSCELLGSPDDLNDNLVQDACEPLGQGFCEPALNSSGQAATIFGLGSASIAEDDVTLGALQAPVNQLGYFLMSTTQDFVPGFSGSDGNLCLGAPIVRVWTGPRDVHFTGTSGAVLHRLRLDSLPQSIRFVPGETWHFQFWFRDEVSGASTSNTSRALTIGFR